MNIVFLVITAASILWQLFGLGILATIIINGKPNLGLIFIMPTLILGLVLGISSMAIRKGKRLKLSQSLTYSYRFMIGLMIISSITLLYIIIMG
ncbi:MAG: hypothetical protein HKN51_05600 [Saprospiraceae bacterium]|nr:hypothetical protein [Bacteroidia bacterium]NNE14429.1 hypothetical protein [Saprospiraceae bacterium]